MPTNISSLRIESLRNPPSDYGARHDALFLATVVMVMTLVFALLVVLPGAGRDGVATGFEPVETPGGP